MGASKLLTKPYTWFFISLTFILLLGIMLGEKLMVFNIHDTYYVIAYKHICYLVAIVVLIVGAIGCISRKKLNRY